jgi:hypothetical protein
MVTRNAGFNLVIVLFVSASVYFGTYSLCRSTHQLVRHIHRDGNYVSGHNSVKIVFRPAWIIERKTRSLIWRIRTGAPLTGHVYWSDLKR